VRCTNCRKQYKVSKEVLGRRVRCQQCGEMFDAVSLDGEPAPAAGSPSAEQSAPDGDPTNQLGEILETERRGPVVVARLLVPRINADNVDEISKKLLALADNPAVKKIVLNLGQVKFLFSTALGTLVSLEKKLQAHGGSLRLCCLQPVVRETLESAGLTILLAVFADEQAALAGF
jgi:anti-sigma B factor antagonist